MTTTTEALMALADDYACIAYAARSAQAAKSSTARAALASAIEDVVRDAGRLDYLDRLNEQKNNHFGTHYGWRLIQGTHRIALEDYHHDGGTVREAIDAAIAAQPNAAGEV